MRSAALINQGYPASCLLVEQVAFTWRKETSMVASNQRSVNQLSSLVGKSTGEGISFLTPTNQLEASSEVAIGRKGQTPPGLTSRSLRSFSGASLQGYRLGDDSILRTVWAGITSVSHAKSVGLSVVGSTRHTKP